MAAASCGRKCRRGTASYELHPAPVAKARLDASAAGEGAAVALAIRRYIEPLAGGTVDSAVVERG
jgi:hypothetical protein